MTYRKPSAEAVSELVGWCGAAVIVGAYALVSFGVVTADDWVFHALNLAGALGVMYISIRKKVGQPAILNAFWAIIALVTLVRLVIL